MYCTITFLVILVTFLDSIPELSIQVLIELGLEPLFRISLVEVEVQHGEGNIEC